MAVAELWQRFCESPTQWIGWLGLAVFQIPLFLICYFRSRARGAELLVAVFCGATAACVAALLGWPTWIRIVLYLTFGLFLFYAARKPVRNFIQKRAMRDQNKNKNERSVSEYEEH